MLSLLLLLPAVTATPALAATPLDLPNLDAMVDYRRKIALRVYTSDGVLIGEFGQERREFVAIKDIPLVQKHARGRLRNCEIENMAVGIQSRSAHAAV